MHGKSKKRKEEMGGHGRREREGEGDPTT